MKRLTILLAATVCALLLLGPTPARAHEGPGSIEVLAADPAEPLTLRYRVKVISVNDGHPAPEATVTATVVDEASPQTPVPMAKVDDGIYEATVSFPRDGQWTVRFASLRPTATLERVEAVAPPPTTTTTAPPTTVTAANADHATLARDAGDDGGNPLLWPGVIGVVVIAAAIGFAVSRPRRPKPSP